MATKSKSGGGIFVGEQRPKPPSPPASVPDGAPGPLTPPRYGWVRLRTIDKRLQVDLRLDEDPPTLTPQAPRLEDAEVPYRATRAWWSGQSAGELEIPCLLDGFPRRPIETDALALETMLRPRSAGKASGMPTPVQVAGNVAGRDRLWVLVEDGQADAIWRDGYRVRQHYVLKLQQYLPLERVASQGRKNPRTSTGALRGRKPVVAKRGDTLATIAARELGSAKRWRNIAELNPVKDKPRRSPSDLRVGERLKLPND